MRSNPEKNIKITFPEKNKFLIVGSGDPVKTFIKKLVKYFSQDQIFIISDKACDRAWSISETEPIETVAKKNNLKIEFVEDINTKEIADKIRKLGCNICFVLGSRWIFKKEFIDIFKGRIFNYHTSDLPNYRGGGGYRWQVMNQEKNIFIAFHQITTEIDRGPILAVARKKLKITFPKDIFAGLYKFTLNYFETFMKKLSRIKTAELKIQDKSRGSYFPLLDNEVNGAIDLNWGVKDIKLFIEAFSHPYQGAFLFYKDKKVFIKEAEISRRQGKFHPFADGLIINKNDKFLEVAGKDGCILFGEFCDANNEKLLTADFRVGDRFYMPPDILLQSKIYRPSNKKFILQVGEKRSKLNKRHKI